MGIFYTPSESGLLMATLELHIYTVSYAHAVRYQQWPAIYKSLTLLAFTVKRDLLTQQPTKTKP